MGAVLMPTKPKHPCNRHGCSALTAERFCPEHQQQATAAYEASRGTATERGYDSNWTKVRAMKLAKDPLCERCLVKGCDVPAVLVHHRDRNPQNNLEVNLESLCKICHDAEHKGERWGR